ncbi:EAL domain-containing protein [Catenovulum sp. 2E275]|uniref:EAL domain-containing protein n=1 Tax=Catenovulum sp. 2E275 TaxID=2980497 RepID=UPI0021CE023B|nr:EAL domain-containing protein [Catenovulum sp. 2E275]MCU4676290.1 EAL domain-containing protein [Catenovulum sp. 2E275]
MSLNIAWLTPWFFATAGMAALAGLVFFALLFTGPKKQQLGALLFMCCIVASFQGIAGLQHLEFSLQSTILYEKILLSIGICFPVALFLFITSYLKPKYFQQWVIGFIVTTLVLNILNWMLPYGIVFREITHVTTLQLSQETLALHAGTMHKWGYIWFIYLMFIFGFCGVWCIKIYRKVDQMVGSFLLIYLIIQFATILVNRLTRETDEAGIITSGFGFIALLVLMSISIVSEFNKSNKALYAKTSSLSREIKKRVEAEYKQSKLTQIVEQDPIATIIISLQGYVINMNHAAQRFWGEDLSNKNIHFLNEVKKLCAANHQLFEFSSRDISLPVLKITPVFKQTFTKISCKNWIKIHIFPILDNSGNLTEYCIRAKDVSKERFVNQTIKQIAQGVGVQGNMDTLQQLVLSLNQIFNSKYAFIGLFNDRLDQVETVAFADLDKISKNFSYYLAGSPCEQVVGNQVCSYPDKVCQRFPDDELLTQMNIEGYVGASMFDEKNSPIGVIGVLDTKALEVNSHVLEVLQIFAARASVEIKKNIAEAEIRKMAYQDYLTNLPNRARLLTELTRLVEFADIEHQHALLLIDLDNFKFVNDSLGNDVADEVLRATGERLLQFSPQEIIARYGGDEFIVVTQANNTVSEYVSRLAEQILSSLCKPIQIGERIVNIQASIGICIFPKHAMNRLDILRYAETALMQAKQAGRNQYRLFSPQIQQKIDERMEIEAELSYAIERGELRLYFQPQVDEKGQCYGAEVLLRWHNAKLGFVSPGVFIPIAEETGLIHQIGDWVLARAIDLLHLWRQRFPDFQLSVNVSAWQFADIEFINKIRVILSKYEVMPNQLTLELTETSLLQNLEEAKLKLTELRLLGFKIALDDFGTGYSSLSYLRDLPLDELKIDKAFVDEIDGKSQQPLIESMVAIAKHMHLHVIAEGVETELQKQVLLDIGCKHYQGYLFAKPMDAGALMTWLNG